MGRARCLMLGAAAASLGLDMASWSQLTGLPLESWILPEDCLGPGCHSDA